MAAGHVNSTRHQSLAAAAGGADLRPGSPLLAWQRCHPGVIKWQLNVRSLLQGAIQAAAFAILMALQVGHFAQRISWQKHGCQCTQVEPNPRHR